MKEIMKACPNCIGRDVSLCESIMCWDCRDSGEVPDVEATLRAEIIRLTATLADRDAEIEITRKAAGEAVDSLRAEVQRLTEECEARHMHEVMLENEKLRMYDEHSRLVRVYNEEAHKSATWWAAEVEKRDKEIRRLRGANDEDKV